VCTREESIGLPKNTPKDAGNPAGGNQAVVSDQLIEKARTDGNAVLKEFESQLSGLSAAEAEARVKRYGMNEIAREKRQPRWLRLLDYVRNPLVILLTALGVLSYLTGDLRATIVIFVMVILGLVLRFFQEVRADTAAEKLRPWSTRPPPWSGMARTPKWRSSDWCRATSSAWAPGTWFQPTSGCFPPWTCS